MSNVHHKVGVSYTATVTLSEAEARAMEYLCSCGVEPLMKALDGLSPSIRRDHALGLADLVQTLRPVLSDQLAHVDAARKALSAITR